MVPVFIVKPTPTGSPNYWFSKALAAIKDFHASWKLDVQEIYSKWVSGRGRVTLDSTLPQY